MRKESPPDATAIKELRHPSGFYRTQWLHDRLKFHEDRGDGPIWLLTASKEANNAFEDLKTVLFFHNSTGIDWHWLVLGRLEDSPIPNVIAITDGYHRWSQAVYRCYLTKKTLKNQYHHHLVGRYNTIHVASSTGPGLKWKTAFADVEIVTVA